jgi:hypothetical protein
VPAPRTRASSTGVVRKPSARAKKKSAGRSGRSGGTTLSIEVDESEGDGGGARESPAAEAGGSKRGVPVKSPKRMVQEHPAVRWTGMMFHCEHVQRGVASPYRAAD